MNLLLAELNALPEHLITVQELSELFPRLPPADKVKVDEMRIPIMARLEERMNKSQTLIIERHRSTAVGIYIFKKFMENGKPIWVFEGKVKHK